MNQISEARDREYGLASEDCLRKTRERERRVSDRFDRYISAFPEEYQGQAFRLAQQAYLVGMSGQLEMSELRRVYDENRELRAKLKECGQCL